MVIRRGKPPPAWFRELDRLKGQWVTPKELAEGLKLQTESVRRTLRRYGLEGEAFRSAHNRLAIKYRVDLVQNMAHSVLGSYLGGHHG